MPSAAIFDLDGTLLDTLEDLADSANEALELGGFPTHPVDSYRTFVGDGMAVLIERILPVNERKPSAIQLVMKAYRAAYDRRWKSKSCPYPGIGELLTDLRARGIPLAVLSNKPQAYTEIVMAHFLGHHRFELILGQREEVPRKPHPAGAHEIALQLGLATSEIIFIGDTATDMDTATAAGMVPVGVLWGFRPEAELLAHGARFLAREPHEIAGLFD